jgi:alkanesulfonate monooxygenase SsuD/methylene tetrahydromethanopterin reductase-like flavin-dependent oxidoreductase (luciferase family)
MKFGVLQFFSWPQRRVGLETVYERALQRIDVMDQTGYDAVWLAEHHFNTYSVCPSVHIMGTHVAARTKNLRIGTAVSLAGMYHPLRLAEEVALLDVLSGGRVNWGAGRGFDPTEFRAFGLTAENSSAKFRENVNVVLAAWRNERLTFHGDYNDFDDIEVLPKPLQDPHPPVWMAASSPEAIEWAAGEGHSIMMDPHSSHADLASKYALYRKTLEAHGYSIEGREIPMARLLAIAPTHDEAAEIARAGAQWTVAAYARPKTIQAMSLSGADEADAVAQPVEEVDPVQRYVDDVIVYGTPSAVVDQLTQLREEMSLEYLLCSPLSHGTFMSFSEDVLPKLA